MIDWEPPQDSLQSSYAKNLQQKFGYPLRFPEPMLTLPSSYLEDGFQIGDVGCVDSDGVFEVLFNICFPADHELHQGKNLDGLVGLTTFDPNRDSPTILDAIASGRAVCHGLQGSQGNNLTNIQSTPCRFTTTATSGAILILPSGAVRKNLNGSKEKVFYKLAEEYALKWCQFAECRSLYLITGFYKTTSWRLASFDDIRPTEQFLLQCDDTGGYTWHSGCDYRESKENHRGENQSVFISGFKIEVRDRDRPVVQKLAIRSQSRWPEFRNFLPDFSGSFWQRAFTSLGVGVERVPPRSQPLHPSNVINHYLLDKNPDALVAITHDSQWLSMLENNELSHENMMDEEQFRVFLEKKYTNDSDSEDVVYLRKKIEISSDMPKLALTPKMLCTPTIPDNIRQFAITYIWVENVVTCLSRMPIGFYVVVEFQTTKRRSKCKPATLHDSIIQWNEDIILPMDSSIEVQISVVASFEFEPILGSGEVLCVLKTSVAKLIEGESTYCPFSSEASLRIILEERQFTTLDDLDPGNSNLECEDHLEMTEKTNKGHEAFLRYQKGQGMEKLKESLECFELALKLCPSSAEYYAAALFNLAASRLINFRAHGPISDLDTAINTYRQALELRPTHHPDRPVTLLHLGQALLVRCRIFHNKETDEIKGLVTEIKQVCSESNYIYRAADLVFQTLKQYQVSTSGTLAELDELISELDQSARMPPKWYFDRPYQLANLGAALHQRFRVNRNIKDLESSILAMEEATNLISDGHIDKPWILASLGDVVCVRYSNCGNVSDLENGISKIKDAVKLAPDGYFDKPRMLASLDNAQRLARKSTSGITELENSTDLVTAHTAAGDDIKEDDMVIAIIGRNGAGKTSFVNKAAGKTPEDYNQSLSPTQAIHSVRCRHPDGLRDVVLLDTPGFDDKCSITQVLENVAKWLKERYQKNIKIAGILYLHRILDSRTLAMAPLRNPTILKDLCDGKIVLITTMWDRVDESIYYGREKQLVFRFWRITGSSTYRFQGTRESAWEIINNLLE